MVSMKETVSCLLFILSYFEFVKILSIFLVFFNNIIVFIGIVYSNFL